MSEGAGAGVGRDDGGVRGLEDVPEGFIGDVRDVDHHAETVHLADDGTAEECEAVVVLDGGIAEVAGAVGPLVGVGPGERHVTDAEAVVEAEEAEVGFDGMAAFDADEGGEDVVGVGLDDVRGGEAKAHGIRVFADLLVDAVDELEGAEGEAASPLLGLDPGGEELGGEVAGASGFEVQHAVAEGRGKVPGFIDKALGGVGVGVDDDGGTMDFEWVGHVLSAGEMVAKC